MSTKMKGILKGIRYISQIFENEKEEEIEIGHPTDVKHVAHIGWDGPATNSAPTWMNEFKGTSTGFSSAPLGNGSGDINQAGQVKWSSEELNRRGGSEQSCSSPASDLPDIPRSSRRQPGGAVNSSVDSPRKKSEKSRQSRKSSKASSQAQSTDPALGSSSTTMPDVPKKTRRKKSKEAPVGGSTRSSTRSKVQSSLSYESPFSDPGPGSGARAMPKNSDEFG